MTQTRKGSIIESIVNTFIGFAITIIVSPFIYWICGVSVNAKQLGLTTLLFTLLSIVRGYFVRRFFNKLIIKNIKKVKPHV